PHTATDANSNTNPDPNTYSNPDPNTYSNTNTHAHANANSHTATYSGTANNVTGSLMLCVARKKDTLSGATCFFRFICRRYL
ncbi:MAG: hypothetical protein RSA20_08605, partial [Oscillospiraceae bacterium]